jgi:hypothetical protein
MAETKTRSTAKRSQGSKKSQARSRGSTKRSSAKPSKPRTRPSNAKSSNARKSTNSSPVGSAKKAVEHTAKDAGNAVGRAATGARVPLVAAGAALVGAAGGVAWGNRHAVRHHRVKSRDVARAAKEIGSFGAQVGELASQLQSAREASNGGKRRSPIEVVLDGLTARH